MLKKYFSKSLFAFFIFSLVGICNAAPYTRNDLTITNMHPMAMDRVHCSQCSGITRIYVNSGSWGVSNCRADAGDLLKEDDHILAILMMGWVVGKKVRIEVDDTVKPLDEVCKITAVYVHD